MSTVRLEFELDSEVYPELHAALTSMRSARARAERMRQLAATGLVWEKVRLHGTAAGPPLAEERPGVVTRADVVAPPATPDVEPLPALERRTAAAKPARPPPSPRRRAGDVVDLAISAEPRPVPEPRPEHRGETPSRRDVEQAIRDLPVLMDVVTDLSVNVIPDVIPPDEHDDQWHHRPDLSEPALWASMNAYPDHVPPQSDEHADDEGLPEPPLHVTTLSHKPATRSRLMRMKERGLFKNG